MHHTTQVLVLANLAQDALTDMELRYEEFLRSGDETADAAYEHDANEFPPLLGALAALTADNPPQVARWTGISSDAERLRTEILEGGVATRREVNAGTASPDMLLSYDSSGTAEKTFSRINSTFGAAIGAERALLDQRTTTADRASSVVLQVLIWGTALTVVLGLALAIDVASRIGASCSASPALHNWPTPWRRTEPTASAHKRAPNICSTRPSRFSAPRPRASSARIWMAFVSL